MVYKRVRGWTLGRSLLVLNFVKYPSRGHILQETWHVVTSKTMVVSGIMQQTNTQTKPLIISDITKLNLIIVLHIAKCIITPKRDYFRQAMFLHELNLTLRLETMHCATDYSLICQQISE